MPVCDAVVCRLKSRKHNHGVRVRCRINSVPEGRVGLVEIDLDKVGLVECKVVWALVPQVSVRWAVVADSTPTPWP